MTVLPSLDVLAAFTAASLVLIFTPGPDMTLFLGETLRGGRARGLAAMLGVATGLLMHTMLVALGLSALLAASAAAFAAIKVAGVAYLLWLAVAALRHGTALTLDAEATNGRPLHRAYLMGLGVNLLNPKIVMFFLTFLPQFVSAADPQAGAKLMFLGFYFIALAVPVCAGLVIAAERVVASLRQSRKVMRAFDWLFAGLMAAFALKLVVSRAE
jgi:threonine/homoserine/homoserine lactone efflux protein